MNSDLHDNPHVTYDEPPRETVSPQAGRTRRNTYKSAALATVLSLMPGLGQVYVGYYPQGFLNAIVVAVTMGYYPQGFLNAIVVAVTITLLTINMGPLTPLLAIFLSFFWVYNMIDANRRAHHYNRAIDGLGGETLPEDFELPGLKGSMPLGVVLIVAGGLFFLDRKFGMSMEWLEEWWPLALVIAGIWLVVKARGNKD